MNPMNMTLVVARKEVKNVIRNKGLLFGGLWFGGMFGVFNVLLSGEVFSLNNAVYSVSLSVGTLAGYSFSSFVFLREKRERVIETLFCTPLSLKSIWFGKVLGATVPAYLFSLLSVVLVIFVSNVGRNSLLFPSVAILIHVLGVVPFFIASATSLIGFCQFMLGMRENRIIGFLIIAILLPFMYPSILSGLVLGDVNVDVSWIEVEVCLIFSVILLALTTYLSRYLSKEKIVTTIPFD
jgi:ABC-2 type transport system permease protein